MDKIWECPSCGKQFKTKDFKFCPYCSTRLKKIVEEFVPFGLEEISDNDKIKAFDELFLMAKEHYNNVKKSFEKSTWDYDHDDDEYYFFETVMDLLRTGIEDGENKVRESYGRFLR